MEVIFLREDREICETMLQKAQKRGDVSKPLGDLIAEAGRYFLGAPYEADTLERKGPERLVVNLRAFDCVTFVESAVALANLIKAGKNASADYKALLARIRYRRGICNGYPSRLHYFTDWLRDNGRKGLIRDITRELGGASFRKSFHKLTDHRQYHPHLLNRADFRRMRIIEAVCSRQTLYAIPKEELPGIEKRIANGDIIAIATDTDGIDVCHTGIAVRIRGRIHLLHASSGEGRVVLSGMTLNRYLKERDSRTGIIVGRAASGNYTLQILACRQIRATVKP